MAASSWRLDPARPSCASELAFVLRRDPRITSALGCSTSSGGAVSVSRLRVLLGRPRSSLDQRPPNARARRRAIRGENPRLRFASALRLPATRTRTTIPGVSLWPSRRARIRVAFRQSALKAGAAFVAGVLTAMVLGCGVPYALAYAGGFAVTLLTMDVIFTNERTKDRKTQRPITPDR